MLWNEPIVGELEDKDYCMLAATHKLANDYKLSVPAWVFHKKYVMPQPLFAYDAEDAEYRKRLEKITPDEYKSKNLYYGNRVLMGC